MDKEEIRNIDINPLTQEEARKISIDFLEDSIDESKLIAKRFGFVSAVLTAGYAIGTMYTNSPVMYGIMGLDAYAISITAKKLFQIAAEKKVLKLMRNNQYDGDYKMFVRDCRDFVNKYYPEEKQKTM